MIKISPLLIASFGICAYAFYYATSGMGGNMVGFGVALIIAGAISTFLIYLGLREAFKDNFRRQVFVELIIVAFCFIVYFLVWLAKEAKTKL